MTTTTTTTTTTSPRFYAACLASYNNGRLHGAWIEATTDVDAMGEEIAAMLRGSPCPNVMVEFKGKQVRSAEEWAIHDHEGLGDIGEHAGLQAVADRVAIVEVAEGRDIPASVLIEAMSDAGATDAEEFVSDKFDGTAESWADFAEERTNDTADMSEVPEWVRNYIDWEAMGRDWRLGGDWSEFTHDGTLYFFSNH